MLTVKRAINVIFVMTMGENVSTVWMVTRLTRIPVLPAPYSAQHALVISAHHALMGSILRKMVHVHNAPCQIVRYV